MDLMADLKWIADRWVEQHNRTHPQITLTTLGSRAVGDGKLFPRILRGRPISVPTFETVINYLGEGTNWPAAMIPDEAASRLVLLGVKLPGLEVYVEREIVERRPVARA